MSENKKSGHKGIAWHKSFNKWEAEFCIDYIRIYVGLFDRLEDAIIERKKKLDSFNKDEYLKNNPEKIKEIALRKAKYKQKSIERYKLYADNPIIQHRNNERAKQSIKNIKQEVIKEYGGICSCCGESEIEFLTIDHIDNKGAEHRRKIGKTGGSAFYRWLKRNRFPKDNFRILCWNCNSARGCYGYCPHEKFKNDLWKFGVKDESD